MKLNDYEVSSALSGLNDWSIDGSRIKKIIPMHNWKGTMMLANAIAHIAERAWHHPDILLSFSSITIYLSTHDVGGISLKDIALAKKIDELVAWVPANESSELEGSPSSAEHRYIPK